MSACDLDTVRGDIVERLRFPFRNLEDALVRKRQLLESEGVRFTPSGRVAGDLS